MNTYWKDEHNKALSMPTGPEASFLYMMQWWEVYAVDHKKRFGSPIGADYVLGAEWERIGDALRGLLNGELGRLDCGLLDASLLETMRSNEVDCDEK